MEQVQNILFFEVMIEEIFHSALFILSCHLGIFMSYYFVRYAVADPA